MLIISRSVRTVDPQEFFAIVPNLGKQSFNLIRQLLGSCNGVVREADNEAGLLNRDIQLF
jgi:hypothetical protein